MANFTLGSASLGTEVDLSGLSDGLDKGRGLAERGGESIGSALGNALTKGLMIAGAAITTALAGIAGAGITSFMGFERQMNEVFSLLPGISQQAMGAMTEQVKDFSTDFGVLPEKVIPALYEALSAGVPPGNVFEFLGVAQKAAIGGVTDVKTTVDGLTSVTNAYGADVLSVGQASDQMFTAVAYGKTNFEELSGSLYNVVPTAVGLGVAFDQVGAALAAMTLQGVPTSVATTQLRSLFIELSKEGTTTSETFQRIAGSGFKDFIASGHTLQDALILMEEAARQSGVGISDLFGSVEAGSAALSLTGQGTAAFTGALDAMQGSTGATERAFQTMDQGIGRSVDYIKSSISVMLTNVGTKLAPTFQVFADWVMAHMPQIESLIVGVFDTIGSMINAVLPFFAAFAETASGAFSVFIDIATQAGQWGLEIGRQLAGGLMSAASYVIESLNYLGSLFTDLLEPHSPPKLLPHIDDWGTETAQVWIDGWTAADFDAFDRIAAVAKTALDGINGVDIKSLLYGPEGSLQSAISELATTGSISATTFDAIRQGAGSAGDSIAGYLRSMVSLEQTSRAAAAAQDELNTITEKYDAMLAPLNAELQAVRDQQTDVRDTARQAELEAIIHSVGGKDSDRKAAKLELEALLIEKKIRDTKKAQAAESSTAEIKLDAATKQQRALEQELALLDKRNSQQEKYNKLLSSQGSGGGGGGGGGAAMDDAAKKAEAAAKAQRDYNFAVADTDTKLAMLREEQGKYTEADAEYWRLQSQVANLEQEKQREIDATTDSMQDYELSLQDTETKLASLKEEQGRYAVGSKEYNDLQKQIDKTEKEREKQLGAIEKKNQESAKAERDYRFAVADTGGQLDILRGELDNTVEGSADYWRIKTQINQLEGQQQRELAATSKAMGGAGAATKGLAGGVGNLSGSMNALKLAAQGAKTPVVEGGTAAATAADQYTDMKDRQLEAAQAATTTIGPIGLFQQALSTISPYADAFKGALAGIALVLVGAQLGAVFTAIGTALAFVVSPLGLLIAGAALLGAAWATNFAGIRDVTMEVIGAVLGVIEPAIALVVGWFATNAPAIAAWWTSTWATIETVVNTVLTAVGSIVTTVLGAVKTFIDQHGTEIQGVFTLAWTTIQTVVNGALDIIQTIIVPILQAIAGFIVAHKDQIVLVFTGAWDIIKGVVTVAMSIIQGVINTVTALIHGDWSGAWEAIKGMFSGIWEGIKSIADGAILLLQTALTVAWDAIKLAFETVWTGIKDFFGGIWDGMKTKLDEVLGPLQTALATAWATITTAAQTAWDGVKSIITGAFTSVLGVIKGPINSIIGVINSLIDGANSVGTALGFGAIPTIPLLAAGTPFWGGGLAVAGEKGPEWSFLNGQASLLTGGVYDLPRGTEVVNARDSARMIPAGGGGASAGTSIIQNFPATSDTVQMRAWALQGTNEALAAVSASATIRQQTRRGY